MIFPSIQADLEKVTAKLKSNPDPKERRELLSQMRVLLEEATFAADWKKSLEESVKAEYRPTKVGISAFQFDYNRITQPGSVVETRRRDGASVVTDRLPLDLPSLPTQGSDPYSALRSLSLPPHVKVVGTANMDETTRTFSPKVLDRAFSIEFAEVDLSAFPVGSSGKSTNALAFGIVANRLADSHNPVNIVEAHTGHADICEESAAYLRTVRAILAPTGISFAYRTRDAVCFYMSNWESDKLESVLPKDDALDYCILQKVLPKVYGQGELLAQTLNTLREWLEGKQVTGFDSSPGFPRSAAKLDRMIKRLDADGTTTYWGT